VTEINIQASYAEGFYGRALARIQRCMLVLVVLTPVAGLCVFGARTALGLVCGCLIALVNFLWLKRGVAALADGVVGAGKTQSAKGVVARFLLRYVLMGAVAYGILTVSPASLYGFLAGLFSPVAAILCEAGYEAYVAMARGV
jgi:hypothetical protein